MNEDSQHWSICRNGQQSPSRKSVKLPGRLAYVLISISEAERRTLLASLLEDFGLDEVVKLGRLQTWQEAVAARANTELNPAAIDSLAPAKHWNCRVIEFPAELDDETWYAIHEVYYEHGLPVAYAASAADPGWAKGDGHEAGARRLGMFQRALQMPLLKESDFVVARAKAALLGKLGQMIEDSGDVRDMASLSSWLEVWISEPLIELRGASPLEVLGTDEGRQQVETLLERMRGGLPG